MCGGGRGGSPGRWNGAGNLIVEKKLTIQMYRAMTFLVERIAKAKA